MTPYFKNYIKRLMKPNLSVIGISIIAPVICWSLPNNFSGIVVSCIITIIMFFSLVKNNFGKKEDYRERENYLLPLTTKELILSYMFKNLNSHALMISFLSCILSFLKIWLLKQYMDISLFVSLLIFLLFGTAFVSNDLRIEFKKLKTHSKILKSVRYFGTFFLWFYLMVFSLKFSKPYFALGEIFVVVLVFFGVSFFLFFNSEKFFNEHIVFSRLKFNWKLDWIYFCLVGAYLIFGTIEMLKVDRRPASVPNSVDRVK